MSLIAGIVVAATPLTSITVLAVLLGIWFIVMGVFEIAGALILRHGVHRAASRAALPRTPPHPAGAAGGARRLRNARTLGL